MPPPGWCRSSRATATGSAGGTSPTSRPRSPTRSPSAPCYELDGLPDGPRRSCSRPTLRRAAGRPRPILTVGSLEHVAALSSWPGRVIVKLASSMRRYGGGIELVEKPRATGLRVDGVGDPSAPRRQRRRPPRRDRALAGRGRPGARRCGSATSRRRTYALLPTSHRYRLRLGTALWHGDKSRAAARGATCSHTTHDRRAASGRLPARHGRATTARW